MLLVTESTVLHSAGCHFDIERTAELLSHCLTHDLALWIAVVTLCAIRFNVTECCIFCYTVFMYFAQFSKQTDFSPDTINCRTVIGMWRVFCKTWPVES